MSNQDLKDHYEQTLAKWTEATTKRQEIMGSAQPLTAGTPVPTISRELAAAMEEERTAEARYSAARDAYYASKP
ncbi:hypothetical protein [Streptacidiphilus sp. EB103A]|uniref:hypothetical protein n=1 Tax=Streptacidiphilus sp. EB103A TaxID=3156275 RepID=UPI003516E362